MKYRYGFIDSGTGLEDLFLQQFYIFGDSPYQLQDSGATELLKNHGLAVQEDSWLVERTLSISYFALVD